VLSIDAQSADPLLDEASTAVVATGDLVYASTDKLFVATTDGGWGGGWIAPMPAPAMGAPATMSAPMPIQPGIPHPVTRIHAFDISHGPARYLASGQVDGYLYGRWAMSERDGLLRLVTTTSAPWSWLGGAQSSVVVLDTAGQRLDVLGQVDGIGVGEQVKAVRWFDDLAAIVTYRQTDPLYLVELSHPTQPRVAGEPRIPGFSEYLHPIGDRLLLGLGRAGTEAGPTAGLGIASFDILDITDPRQTGVLGLGRYASSPVEGGPRGFVYLPDQRLAVLPVQPQPKCFTTAFVCSGVDGNIRLPHGPGLVSVQVAKDGALHQAGAWTDAQSGSAEALKALPLPGGRIAVLDGRGVTLLRSADLSELGRASF
jgi:beta propeller domain-containing protein